jgi:simple sugar transport system permease protein
MVAILTLAFPLRSIIAVLLALLLGALLMLSVGADPVAAYRALFGESFFDYFGIANTLVKTSPILLAGLAVAIPLRAGVYNIGGEGQIYLGGLFATTVALTIPDFSPGVGIPLVMVAAVAGGAFWAAIPAVMRAYYGINEVIVTLLMNFIGIQIVSYAVSGPMLAKSAPYPYSEEISENLHLTHIMPSTDAHLGVVFAIVLALSFWLFFKRTSAGLAIDMVGRSATAAKYAGVAVQRQILLAMILGGGMAGLAGGLEVIGHKYRLFHMFSNGYGYDGIVATFVAMGSTLWLPLVALFLAGLKAGAGIMERSAGIERSVVDAIQGIVVLMVAASLSIRPGFVSFLALRKEHKAQAKADERSVGATPAVKEGN